MIRLPVTCAIFIPNHEMRIKAVIFFLLAAIITACSTDEEGRQRKIPDNILQPGAMVAIIADIQIAEAVLRERRQTGQYQDQHALDLMNSVFEKHGVSREKYRESLRFYENNLEIYEQIYEDVITLLTQKQTELSVPRQ